MKSGWKAATAASASGALYGGLQVADAARRPAGARLTAIAAGIAVDAQHLGARAPERLRVAAVAQGRVHRAARARGGGEHRREQDRDVDWDRGVGHVAAPGSKTKHPVRGDGVARSTEGAGLTGLEPATSAVTVRHSNQAELQPLGTAG